MNEKKVSICLAMLSISFGLIEGKSNGSLDTKILDGFGGLVPSSLR